MIILYVTFFFTLVFLFLMLFTFASENAPNQLMLLFIFGFLFCSFLRKK